MTNEAAPTKTQLAVRVTPDVHRRLKIAAAVHGTSVQQIVEEAIVERLPALERLTQIEQATTTNEE